MRRASLAGGGLRAVALMVLAALVGCSTVNAPPPVEGMLSLPPPAAVRPAATPVAAPPVSGAIFQGAGYRPLFENHRARQAGDTIVVQLAEKTTASQRANSSIDKSGKVEGSVTALPFLAPNSFNRASVAGANNNGFSGKGATESSSDLSGTITATVVDVLPNGHLLIAGEKQFGLNHHVDVLRFSGQVDPRSILPGNVVPSPQVANVRIEQRGRGAQGEAQGIGWLSRVFLNVLPF